jgi:DNA ligase-1
MLYGLASNGKIKTVKYTVEELTDGTCDIVNEHGYIDGKKQIDRRNIKSGKNLGKKNETTVQEQAISEVESKISKKKDNNYTENDSGEPDIKELSLLPMLAQTFSKIDSDGKERGRKHHIKYPCICQPKLNGVRCLTRLSKTDKHKAVYTSRKFKEYKTLKHLTDDLLFLFPELSDSQIPIDGEIYKHGLTLQQINRLVKKYRPEETEELEYWVYDVGMVDTTNEKRDIFIDNAFKLAHIQDVDRFNKLKVKQVQSWVALDEETVYKLHDRFVKEGYEGVIIRNKDGLYTFDKRSNDLQKYKEFIDDEFEILNYTSGEGREEGAIIFICKVKNPTDNGPTQFEVRPRGSIEMRKDWAEDGKSFIGKELTVRFQEYTEDNVPSFPVGIAVRDYE